MTGKVLRWERRPDERPSELLEAALYTFAERGYANTRLEDVAATVGVTKGTIYHYFATKEDLLLRAIEQYHERVFAPLEEIRAQHRDSVAATIRLFLRRAFGNLDAARLSVLTLLVQGVSPDVPKAFARWLESGPVRGWRILAELIEEGQANGEFRRDADAEVAARITMSGLVLQFAWQRYGESAPSVVADAGRLIDAATEQLLHGLKAPTRTVR
ncbi:MAG TPA: TetR/AcrR family transcriptional regulator [Gemmatimonadaceae bacterium]|nr:TetR/AcrR family transcriptional regulator [Gemmatimonadaceae bacterium]